MTVNNDASMVVASVTGGKPLSSISQQHIAAVGLSVPEKSFDKPYSVSASGEVDLNRIQSVGVLRYTPSRGYFIEEKKPLLQAKTPKSTLVITTVNGPRRNNALTLYTSSFGESTNTNEFGYEVTVSNGKVLKVGNGNSALGEQSICIVWSWCGHSFIKIFKSGHACCITTTSGTCEGRNCWWRYG